MKPKKGKGRVKKTKTVYGKNVKKSTTRTRPRSRGY